MTHKRLIVCLFGLLISTTVLARPSLDNRVEDLERLTLGHSQLLSELQSQLTDLQQDIDNLRGQMQMNQYQLEQAIERQKVLFQHIDDLGKGKTTNTVSTGSQSSGFAFSGDEKQDYNDIVSIMLDKKDYDQAIPLLQDFIKRYPKSRYLANSNYWLGQMFYSKGKRDEASHYYAVVVKDFPKDQKAADAMFKVGIIFQEKNDKVKAKAIFQQVVKQYANTQIAAQAQKRLDSL